MICKRGGPFILQIGNEGDEAASPLVVRIGEHVRVDVRYPDASSAAWVALLAAGCMGGGVR